MYIYMGFMLTSVVSGGQLHEIIIIVICCRFKL